MHFSGYVQQAVWNPGRSRLYRIIRWSRNKRVTETGEKITILKLLPQLQGDQLNISLFMVSYKKGLVQCIRTLAYIGQLIFYKIPENTAVFNWSPCRYSRQKFDSFI